MRRIDAATLVLTAAWLTGCAQQLMTTPNLCLSKDENPFDAVAPECRTPIASVLYATDRVATRIDEKLGVEYGFHRSQTLAFGSCDVSLGCDDNWDVLIAESRTQQRSRPLPLAIRRTTERGRFAAHSDLLHVIDGAPVPNPDGVAQQAAAERQFHELLSERLARTSKKEVFVYIHGFNNQFYEAAFVIAQLWHFLERQGVPVFYSWPAGSAGAMGYAYDRESGEFTVWHLKQFLRALATHPEIQRIHIVAHSRGTDVATTAVRELHLEDCDRRPELTRERLKIGNVILAAADLDLQVTGQRIAAEQLLLVPQRLTLYLSPKDRALGFALWLFESMIRLGQLTEEALTPDQREALAQMPQLNLIQADVTTDWLGHDYFYSNPAVSSDLILLLRDNRAPGAEHGRPLESLGDNFWRIRDDYCLPNPRP